MSVTGIVWEVEYGNGFGLVWLFVTRIDCALVFITRTVLDNCYANGFGLVVRLFVTRTVCDVSQEWLGERFGLFGGLLRELLPRSLRELFLWKARFVTRMVFFGGV